MSSHLAANVMTDRQADEPSDDVKNIIPFFKGIINVSRLSFMIALINCPLPSSLFSTLIVSMFKPFLSKVATPLLCGEFDKGKSLIACHCFKRIYEFHLFCSVHTPLFLPPLCSFNMSYLMTYFAFSFTSTLSQGMTNFSTVVALHISFLCSRLIPIVCVTTPVPTNSKTWQRVIVICSSSLVHFGYHF